MLVATKGRILPTAMVGSFSKPSWFNQNLQGRPFMVAMGDSQYREQYIDSVACYLSEQERAGLDILTDGDALLDVLEARGYIPQLVERYKTRERRDPRLGGPRWRRAR
jgi:5-methyltetrahydropteroyltriglutamate--homocysteine methyltransferase